MATNILNLRIVKQNLSIDIWGERYGPRKNQNQKLFWITIFMVQKLGQQILGGITCICESEKCQVKTKMPK